MEILLIDNYDSFTYNLRDYLQRAGARVDTRRVNELDAVLLARYHGVVISPGPGLPQEMPGLTEITAIACQQQPVLGICLGLQAIVAHFGGRLRNLEEVVHGISTPCFATGQALFHSLSSPFQVGHYHSWVADEFSLHNTPLEVVAVDNDQHVMALQHNSLPVWGLQFHPESVLTPGGEQIIANWIVLAKKHTMADHGYKAEISQ